MAFDFSEGYSVLVQGIVDAQAARANVIAGIKRIPNIEYPISGVALDLAPWHGGIGLSFRLAGEFELERRYNSADWEYFDLVSDTTFPGLKATAEFIHDAYVSEGEESPARLEMAHLVFLL